MAPVFLFLIVLSTLCTNVDYNITDFHGLPFCKVLSPSFSPYCTPISIGPRNCSSLSMRSPLQGFSFPDFSLRKSKEIPDRPHATTFVLPFNCEIWRKPIQRQNFLKWEPLIISNLSLPRRRESSYFKGLWIPAFAGMTFLEVAK